MALWICKDAMQTLTLSLGQLSTNCYIVYQEDCRDAVVIDPADDADAILQELDRHGLRLAAILLTHGHFDHMMAVDPLLDAVNADFFISALDAPLLTDAMLNGTALFLGIDFTLRHSPTGLLQDQDEIPIGKSGLVARVFSTPGHTAGSAAYCIGDTLFTGDLLFRLMVGRTDLPTGSAATLKNSLAKITSLSEDYKICPGHGPASTLSYEKRHNIFLR